MVTFIFSVGKFSRWLHLFYLFLVSGGLVGGYIYFIFY